MTSKIALWMKASRAPFFQAAIIPVVLGGALAAFEGSFSWLYLIIAAIGCAMINGGTNFINDYYDHRSLNDDVNIKLTPFSGGSRMIQEGLIPPRKIFHAGIICFLIAGIIGIFFLIKIG